MSIDLNGAWTEADVAKLLSGVADDRDWRLEVSRAGVVTLEDKTAHPTDAEYDEGLHCYFETWMQGTDFVGPSAASDKSVHWQDRQGAAGELPDVEGGQIRLRGSLNGPFVASAI